MLPMLNAKNINTLIYFLLVYFAFCSAKEYVKLHMEVLAS